MKKILSIIDMQNDFTTGTLGNKDCINVIDKICEIINTRDYDYIILTRDTHYDNYLNTQEGKFLPVVHCTKDTNGWEVVQKITDCVNNKAKTKSNLEIIYVDKPSFGSIEFGNTVKNIIEQNKDCDMTIDFTGVCTGICVISNVMITKACCPELEVHVIKDACACVTPQSHETALNAMKTVQVYVD